jgi:hypothetical protein
VAGEDVPQLALYAMAHRPAQADAGRVAVTHQIAPYHIRRPAHFRTVSITADSGVKRKGLLDRE